MLHHSDLIWEYIINRLHNNKSDLRFGGHILYEFDDFYKGLDHYIESNKVVLSVDNKLTINIYKFNAYTIIWNLTERKISVWTYISPLRTVVDYPLENYEDIFNKPVNINTLQTASSIPFASLLRSIGGDPAAYFYSRTSNRSGRSK